MPDTPQPQQLEQAGAVTTSSGSITTGNEITGSPTSSGEAWWKLKNIQVDTVVKIISTLGIFGAIFGAWITYEENEVNSSVLDLKVNADPIELPKDQSLLMINIDLANKGKRPLGVYSHKDDIGRKEMRYSGEGLTLSITRHALPDKEGLVENDNEERVVERFNILESKYSYHGPGTWDRVYGIKPSNTYRETEAVVLKRNALYELVVRFYGIRNGETFTNTETKFVYIK